MVLDDGFTADAPWQFLMALNGSPMFVRAFVEQERVPAPAPLNFCLRPKDEHLHRQAQETFVSHLRRLADEWIGTGRDSSGQGEEPGKRRLTQGLRRIVNDWWAMAFSSFLAS